MNHSDPATRPGGASPLLAGQKADLTGASPSAARARPGARLKRALAALAVPLAAFGAAACDREDAPPAAEVSAAEARETVDLLAGIHQEGIALGDPDAPVTLVEFIDLDCAHCRTFTIDVLPELIRRYVREGKVRMELRTLAFVSERSVEAARMAAALGLQDRMWHFVDLYFRSQEPAAAPAADRSLRRLAQALPQVDAERAMAERSSPDVTRQLAAAEELERRFDIQGTPSFLIGRTGEAPRTLDLPSLTPEPFARAIDELLKEERSGP
jgi:protein-disulfide isomerase